MDWSIPVAICALIIAALLFAGPIVRSFRGRMAHQGRPGEHNIPTATFVDTSQSANQPPRHHHHQQPQRHQMPPTYHTPPVHHVPPPTHHVPPPSPPAHH